MSEPEKSPFTGIFAVDKKEPFKLPEGSPPQPSACDCPWSTWHRTQKERALEAATRATLTMAGLDLEVQRLRIMEKTGFKPRRKAIIPHLKPHTIERFLCAIPRAVVAGEITAAQANGLLYGAQVFISLIRARTTHPPPPTTLGFSNSNPKGQKN